MNWRGRREEYASPHPLRRAIGARTALSARIRSMQTTRGQSCPRSNGGSSSQADRIQFLTAGCVCGRMRPMKRRFFLLVAGFWFVGAVAQGVDPLPDFHLRDDNMFSQRTLMPFPASYNPCACDGSRPSSTDFKQRSRPAGGAPGPLPGWPSAFRERVLTTAVSERG